MTDREAQTEIRRYVKSKGGNTKHLKMETKQCVAWNWTSPKSWSDKRCSCHWHPKDCPTGLKVCRVEFFKAIKGVERLGIPGFIEVIAETHTWEEALAKVKQRVLW